MCVGIYANMCMHVIMYVYTYVNLWCMHQCRYAAMCPCTDVSSTFVPLYGTFYFCIICLCPP